MPLVDIDWIPTTYNLEPKALMLRSLYSTDSSLRLFCVIGIISAEEPPTHGRNYRGTAPMGQTGPSDKSPLVYDKRLHYGDLMNGSAQRVHLLKTRPPPCLRAAEDGGMDFLTHPNPSIFLRSPTPLPRPISHTFPEPTSGSTSWTSSTSPMWSNRAPEKSYWPE